MLTRTVLLILAVHWIKTSQEIVADELFCDGLSPNLFKNIMIDSFIDKNRYIRMNISWKDPTASFDTFEILIDSECTALYGEPNLTIDKEYLIVPNMERLLYPAEPLQHGCQYDFEFISDIHISDSLCHMMQRINYTIPECVEDVCMCSIENYSFQYDKYQLVSDNIYKISFQKNATTSNINIEEAFDKIWYTNVNSNKTMSIVHHGQITFNNTNSSLILPFNEFQDGNTYSINIDLLEDDCEYYYSFQIDVPASQSWVYNIVIYSSAVVLICGSLGLLLYKLGPQFFNKLKKHILSSQESVAVVYSIDPSAHILPKTTTEMINSQYTPLEFIMNCHKYDDFEHPRNKIIIKDEIGGGSFGKVYNAEIHDLNNTSGFIEAAVKKPLDHAPSEEISDFLSEIETMKKIVKYGGHPNVVRLFACVSIDKPYIMVMELIPCGDLKSYLYSLRKQWDAQRNEQKNNSANSRHFFPDNMVVENYLPGVEISDEAHQVKYSDLTFDDFIDELHDSDDTSSYIMPESPITPTISSSTLIAPSQFKTYSKLGSRRGEQSERTQRMMKNYSLGPPAITPNSIASSGLPSITETLLTPLESTPASPLIHEPEIVKPVLDSRDLHTFALQIANGMAFLESIDITHRDLAARNILMGYEKVLKISDFGMAREGVYVNTAQKRQPLRWMAPEAIENRRCDSKTDVWSFGVVLWEIGSLGAFPYKNLSNEMVIAQIFKGQRLQTPETCTDQLSELMQSCWRSNPEERPTFQQISKTLGSESGKVYVDFSKISPKYIFPPIQQENY